MSEWVSVDDGLPDVDELVHVFDDRTGEYWHLRWTGEYWTTKEWPCGLAPSHWQPLPPPPTP